MVILVLTIQHVEHTHTHTCRQFFFVLNLPYMQIWTMCLLLIERNVCVCVCVCALFSIKYWTSREFQWIPHPSLSLLLVSSLCKHKMSWERRASPGPPVPLSRLKPKTRRVTYPAPNTRPYSASAILSGVASASAVSDRSSSPSDVAGWRLLGPSRCRGVWCAFSGSCVFDKSLILFVLVLKQGHVA